MYTYLALTSLYSTFSLQEALSGVVILHELSELILSTTPRGQDNADEESEGQEG